MSEFSPHQIEIEAHPIEDRGPLEFCFRACDQDDTPPLGLAGVIVALAVGRDNDPCFGF
ncbi:hypothetical protein ACFSM5_10850 [Lacibacterium aquatile]|uniref:Uncharacterized protein n=1 Tax=Lacibacterium aquatile TaxID=1168082 RepID=A0ABW5DQR3_9PROT